MNLSLTNRIKLTFIVANLFILLVAFLMYFFLGRISDTTEQTWEQIQSIRGLDESMRNNIVDMVTAGAKLEENKVNIKNLNGFKEKTNELKSNLERLKTENQDESSWELLKTLSQSTNTLLEYIGDIDNQENRARFKNSRFHLNLLSKISQDFSAYLKKSHLNSEESAVRVKTTITNIKKNMLMVLILAFLGTIILGWLIPHKVALPFRKINHAIEELQNCNFDVSIAYDEEDEIGYLATSLNKMITQLKKHEELRADKFVLENRKFNLVVNHIEDKVLVANSDGRLTFMSNNLYSMLRLETSDVIDRELKESVIPESIMKAFRKALTRRGKIENEEISFTYKTFDDDEQDQERNFHGYAEIYPIRGKESSLDYYLMIISEEMAA